MKDVIKKLKFKSEGIILNAPSFIEKSFIEHGFRSELNIKVKNLNAIIFLNNNKELLTFLKQKLKHLEYDSVLWFAYPKISSGIKTDINRGIIANLILEFGLDAVTAASIVSSFSTLRLRPIEIVGKKS